MLRGGGAVAPTLDGGVEAGDQGSDALEESALPIEETAQALRNITQSLGEGAENILEFEVLLPNPQIELSEPFFLEPVPLSENPDHLFAGLTGGEAPEAANHRHLQVRQASIDMGAGVGIQ